MTIVFPGQRLGYTSQYQASNGTYERDGQIYASLLGKQMIVKSDENSQSSSSTKPKIQVYKPSQCQSTNSTILPNNPITSSHNHESNKPLMDAIPQVHSVVTGKVIRITPRFAVLSILVVGQVPCKEQFQGVIRVQDVRATEKDKVQIFKCFRPGDIVRAQVISLGDSRSYYLSTASNELGVILAQSMSGYTMVPISWEEMMCPVTKVN